MVKPSDIQSERARTRIKQMIATRKPGRTKGKEKLRIGKLLGYKGKDSNIIRSVDRVITTDRNSPSARELRSTDQVRKIDRSFRNRTKNQTITGDDFETDITAFVKPILRKSDFSNPKFDVWLPGAVQAIGQKIFGKRRGIIRGEYVSYSGQGQVSTLEGVYPINSLQGQLPLATTFGYLDNKEDLYHIWNLRLRLLFTSRPVEGRTSSFVTQGIFNKQSIPEEDKEELLNQDFSFGNVGLDMGYYKTVKELRQ
tara:strand:- start:953 stop:1714 length:762 start_codon:yes stop_codon:yes gene_type:complete